VHRFFGAFAILAGWLSIPVGAMFGLFVSEFFGLSHIEGAVAPSAVYGISGTVVLWVFVAAGIMAALPVGMAMVAPDPKRQIRLLAVVMAVAGLVLIPDQLGRAYGSPLLVGAACMWVGGDLIRRDTATVPLGSSTPSDSRPAATPDPSNPEEPHAPAAPAAAAAAAAPSAAARARRGPTKARSSGPRTCPWCSSRIPAKAVECPNCHATVDEPALDALSIPGLTEVPSNLRSYDEAVRAKKKRPSVLGIMFNDSSIPDVVDAPAPSDAAALRPPSQSVKAEMARLDAEIAAGELSLASTAPEVAAAGNEPDATEPDRAREVKPAESSDRPGRSRRPLP
jgi:hypothetical protein